MSRDRQGRLVFPLSLAFLSREWMKLGIGKPAGKFRSATKQLGADCETSEYCGTMGNSQGRDNVRKRAARRKKTERLAAAKKSKTKPKK